jgi:YD repeat-containing protein
MQKLNFVFIILFLFFFGNCLFAFPILPEPFKLPQTPKPGAVKCKSCGHGERPRIDRFCYAVTKISLFEEKDLPENELLSVNIGTPGPFSPETRYLIHPPGAPGAIKDYLMVEIGRWKVLFKAEMDKIGSVGFWAVNLPGYAIKREGDYLVLTDYNSLCEFSFTSLDAGQTWKLIKLRRLNQLNFVIKCEYDNEGYMTKVILPGPKTYKIYYKYGQVQRVISPSGAVTIFYWNESGFLSRLKTVLTKFHPFYNAARKNRKNLDRKTKLPIVRDVYIESTMDGHLASLTTTSGERYKAEYLLDRTKKRTITTGILVRPNGRRDYRMNKTGKGGRQSEKGVVEKKDGIDVFKPFHKLSYASTNGSLYLVSSNGIKQKRAPGTLAVTEKINALGHTTRYKYNKLWLRTQTTNPDGSIAKKKYDDHGKTIKETDECGRVKTYKRNKEGLLSKYISGDVTMKYEYDSLGYPAKAITADGLIHKFAWDKFGRMTSHVKPDGVAVQYQYFGLLDYLAQETTSGNDNEVSHSKLYLYDAKGRLTRVYYSDKTYEGFAYNCCNIIAQRLRNGKIMKYSYDSNQKRTKVLFNKKIVYQAKYDKYGRLLKRVMPDKTWSIRKYGKDGYTSASKTSDGTIKKYYRNVANWVNKAVTNKETEVLYEHNYKRKITSIRGTDEPWLDNDYDETGNLIGKTYYGLPKNSNPNMSRTVKHEYDASNRKVKTVYPDGRVQQKVYKKGSEQLDYTRADNVYTFYAYNDKGQVKSISIVTKKDLDSALTKLERKALLATKISEYMKYDSLGRLVQKLDKNNRIIALYNYYKSTGRVTHIIEPVSDKYGAIFSYRRNRKKFIKFVKLDKYMT